MPTTETNGSGIRETRKTRRGRYGNPSRDGDNGPGHGRDRGQTAIEFLGVTPLIILLMIALWQCALIGYTFSLAGNAADEAAHKGAVTEGPRFKECQDAAREHLPEAWRKSMGQTRCQVSSGLYKAEVKLQVPILVPGVLDWKQWVTGSGAAPLEG
jgi:TadE-like protein